MSIVTTFMDILKQAMQPEKLLGAGAGAVGQILAMRLFGTLGLDLGGDLSNLIATNMVGQLVIGNVIEMFAGAAGIGY